MLLISVGWHVVHSSRVMHCITQVWWAWPNPPTILRLSQKLHSSAMRQWSVKLCIAGFRVCVSKVGAPEAWQSHSWISLHQGWAFSQLWQHCMTLWAATSMAMAFFTAFVSTGIHKNRELLGAQKMYSFILSQQSHITAMALHSLTLALDHNKYKAWSIITVILYPCVNIKAHELWSNGTLHIKNVSNECPEWDMNSATWSIA